MITVQIGLLLVQLLLLMAFYIAGTGVLNIVTPLTPMSDQDRISPYNMRLLLLLELIQYQIIWTNIIRIA